MKFVPKGSIKNISALVRIMAWRLPGDKPLPDPKMVWSTDAYMRHSALMSEVLQIISSISHKLLHLQQCGHINMQCTSHEMYESKFLEDT